MRYTCNHDNKRFPRPQEAVRDVRSTNPFGKMPFAFPRNGSGFLRLARDHAGLRVARAIVGASL